MSFFGGVKKLVRKSTSVVSRAAKPLSRVVRTVSKIPGVKTLARAVPFLGTAIAVAEGVSIARRLVRKSSVPRSAGIPELSGLPAIPMGGSGPGLLPRGVDGNLQLPWNDPRIPDSIKQFAIDDAYLKSYVRAPRGFVVLRDEDGQPFGVRRDIAQKMKFWKAGKKPPISVGDWSHLQGADRVVRKFKQMEKRAMRIANFNRPRRSTSYVVSSQPAVKRIASIK